MAHTGIFATSGQVILKAGVNANMTAISESSINDFCVQVENQINVESEYDWSTNYGSLDATVKSLLSLAASNKAAIYAIAYDPTAWTTNVATFKINVLQTGYDEAIKMLRETDKAVIFIREA